MNFVFQFTPLREGRHVREIPACEYKVFQFTPLREGRLEADGIFGAATQFQFTPLREGRLLPLPRRRNRAGGRISIHAPPRGATNV